MGGDEPGMDDRQAGALPPQVAGVAERRRFQRVVQRRLDFGQPGRLAGLVPGDLIGHEHEHIQRSRLGLERGVAADGAEHRRVGDGESLLGDDRRQLLVQDHRQRRFGGQHFQPQRRCSLDALAVGDDGADVVQPAGGGGGLRVELVLPGDAPGGVGYLAAVTGGVRVALRSQQGGHAGFDVAVKAEAVQVGLQGGVEGGGWIHGLSGQIELESITEDAGGNAAAGAWHFQSARRLIRR